MSDNDTIAIWAEAWSLNTGIPIIGNTALKSGLPWPTNSADLRHFRASTRNRLLIMGRNTFNSLPDILKTPESLSERPIVIITSKPMPKTGRIFEDGIVEWDPRLRSNDMRAVVSMLKLLSGKTEAAVIGGSGVIELFESAIDKLVVTHINDLYEGDVEAPSNEFLEAFPVKKRYNVGTATVVEHTRLAEPTCKDCE